MHRTVNRLITKMLEEKLTLALAESVTCGLAAHQLSTVKGTSDVLKGSIVCYNEEVKKDLLKIKKSTIEKHTAESANVTKELALSLRKVIKADIHAAITGLASPGGSETKSKPVGTAFYAISFRNKIYTFRKRFRGSPLEIRKKMCNKFYQLILSLLEK
jgi:nicotinamide-nucleotide amidase